MRVQPTATLLVRTLTLSVLAVVGALAPVRADITDPPLPWNQFPNPTPISFQGVPQRDFEGGQAQDPTNGGASFTAEVDISSGGPTYLAANCNPAIPGFTQCGNQPSGYWSYYNGGGTPTTADDYLFLRMRVNADPRRSGQQNNCLTPSHWNFLLDIDGDGFKEFWLDAWGNTSRIRVLYQNNPSQVVTNDNQVPPATDTWINEFAFCASSSGTCSGTNFPNVTCANSHGRVCGAGSTGTNCNANTDSTGEWFVDIQVPINYLTDATGDMGAVPITRGTPLLTTYPPQIGFFLSTSDSSTDPVQKDYISTCTSVPTGPCAFSDTTPVSVAHFRSQRKGNGVVFEWSTATENGNAGFDVLVQTEDGWQPLSKRLVASKVVYSLRRTDYRVELPNVEGEVFALRDHDLLGKTRLHGPYELGERYGSRRTAPGHDWKAIGTEHRAKVEARQRGMRRFSATTAAAQTEQSAGIRIGLEVSEDGLYRLTSAQLAAAGFDWSGIPAKDVTLLNRGIAVPANVVPAANGSFGAGAYLEFWGEAVRGLYTHTNVYQLTTSKSQSKPVATRPGAPKGSDDATTYTATNTVDENLRWSFGAPSGDPWYREFIVAGTSPVTRSYPLQVDDLVSDAGARLNVELWGMTDHPEGMDHHVRVALNGVQVADRLGGGIQSLAVDAAIPAGLLQEGANTVSVTVVGDTGVPFDVVAVDRFSVRYGRALEARADRLVFGAPATGGTVKVTGLSSSDVAVYHVASGRVTQLRDPAVAADGAGFAVRFDKPFRDGSYAVSTAGAMLTPGIRALAPVADIDSGAAQYLVITHPDFASGVAPLVAARSAGGLAVKVVTTDEVFARYSGDVFDPQAIRSYIARAAANQGTESVLLVGADTYDYLDYTNLGSISFVPTLYAQTGPLVRYTPADSLYGDLDRDGVPDLPVGRLPVRTAAELASVVAKTLAYDGGAGARRVLLAADRKDFAGDFAQISEEAAGSLPASWSIDRAYIDQSGVAAARTAISDSLNSGARLAHYLGHSDTSFWSFSSLWTNAQVGALTNSSNPTVVTQWGCWNTFYANPDASSISDKWMTSAGGAAAVIGPAGLTDVSSDRQMSPLLLAEATRPGQTIGQALIAAKRQLAATHPWMVDVIVGVNLMGDPALVIEP